MNILTKIRLLNDLNDREVRMGIVGTKASWHEQYRESAWVYAGGIPYELTEGDIICVFSQYGEVVNINLVRDKKTGKSKGFAFICYEDQRSTVLAVDNLNGGKIKGRQIRVDHVLNYKPPKDDEEADELTKKIWEEGVAPQLQAPSAKEEINIKQEIIESDSDDSEPHKKKRKREKKKKETKELKFLKKKGERKTSSKYQENEKQSHSYQKDKSEDQQKHSKSSKHKKHKRRDQSP